MPIRTGADYLDSLRGRNLAVYLFGERVPEPVDHPVIRPSANAMAATYDLAVDDPELATTHSPLVGRRVNRFLHVAQNAAELVMQNRMQRRLGQLTGTCFQRCVGMDALNALYSVTHETDAREGFVGYLAIRAGAAVPHHRPPLRKVPEGASRHSDGAAYGSSD